MHELIELSCGERLPKFFTMRGSLYMTPNKHTSSQSMGGTTQFFECFKW